jgi:predicted NAD-dependent protein-ADP-ribosyltransferase YbiA (DUF1768 family)
LAEIVGGFASSHTLLVSVPGQEWESNGERDKHERRMIRRSDGVPVSYEELLASTDPRVADEMGIDIFDRKQQAVQEAVNELQRSFAEVDPDVVVMFGDDQEELLFDDNYPMISVYWGETLTHYPRILLPGLSEQQKKSAGTLVFGTEIIDYPVQSDLGRHVVEELVEREFDVAQSRYLNADYGGTVGPGTWYLDYARSTTPRRFGMPHAFSFPVSRWFAGKRPPMVPIFINTCYPPNWISPKRAFNLGRAVREAIHSWDSSLRVAVATSGGLSHFTVDEEIDRLAIEGLTKADPDILTSLPRYKLQSATTEILNWVAVAGAMGEIPMELLTYQAGYRSPAGTGCGLAVGRWL